MREPFSLTEHTLKLMPTNENSPRKKYRRALSVTKSTTDKECGMFHKGEHERQFAYVANMACDKNNFVLDFVVGAGNIHDSVMFDEVYGGAKRFPKVETVAVDARYKKRG